MTGSAGNRLRHHPSDFGIGYGGAFINRIRGGVGTGPADTAAAGPII